MAILKRVPFVWIVDNLIVVVTQMVMSCWGHGFIIRPTHIVFIYMYNFNAKLNRPCYCIHCSMVFEQKKWEFFIRCFSHLDLSSEPTGFLYVTLISWKKCNGRHSVGSDDALRLYLYILSQSQLCCMYT